MTGIWDIELCARSRPVPDGCLGARVLRVLAPAGPYAKNIVAKFLIPLGLSFELLGNRIDVAGTRL
jgi:hypothetical protein